MSVSGVSLVLGINSLTITLASGEVYRVMNGCLFRVVAGLPDEPAGATKPDRVAFDVALNEATATGGIAALEVFARKLRDWSGDAYRANRDEKASWYRDVAERAEAEAEKLRKGRVG